MTVEEKAAHDALLLELKSLVSSALGDTVDKKSFDSLVEKLNGLEKKESVSQSDFDKIKEEHIQAMVELKALKELGSKKEKEEVKSFAKSILSALEEKKAEIDAYVESKGKSSPISLEIKAAVDLTTLNTIGAGTTQYTITQNTGIISPIRKRLEKYLNAVSVGSISTEWAMWVEETDEQGTPIFIAEGAGATQLSVKYVEKTARVKIINVYGKVTLRMLQDLPQLVSYIQNNMMKRVSLKTEDALFSGDGLNDNLQGVIPLATAFSAGANANNIVSANEFDVANAVGLQVEVANGEPNAIFIHPATLSAMKGLKAAGSKEPIYKSYLDIAGTDMEIYGMKVYTTTAITAGYFLGGDLRAANVLFYEKLNIQIGASGDDFINTKKTILVQSSLVQFVSANDTPVLVYGDFATAITALNKL